MSKQLVSIFNKFWPSMVVITDILHSHFITLPIKRTSFNEDSFLERPKIILQQHYLNKHHAVHGSAYFIKALKPRPVGVVIS